MHAFSSVEDYRRAARRRLTKLAFDYLGGSTLAPLAALPPIVEVLGAGGAEMAVFLDGGVRRGADVAKAVALGAKGVLLGRAPLYGVAARGREGATGVLTLLLDALRTTMQLLGCAHVGELTAQRLARLPALQANPL